MRNHKFGLNFWDNFRVRARVCPVFFNSTGEAGGTGGAGGAGGGGAGGAERAKRAELTGLDTDTQYKLTIPTQYKLTVPTHNTSLPYRHTIQAYRATHNTVQGVPKGSQRGPQGVPKGFHTNLAPKTSKLAEAFVKK